MTHQLKQAEKKLSEEKKVAHEFQMKHMLDRKKVFVEGEADEVDITTANMMGQENSISQKQLKELQDKVKSMLLANDDLKREMTRKEETLKSLADKAMNEKGQIEKQLFQTEFLVAEKNKEIEKIRHENM